MSSSSVGEDLGALLCLAHLHLGTGHISRWQESCQIAGRETEDDTESHRRKQRHHEAAVESPGRREQKGTDQRKEVGRTGNSSPRASKWPLVHFMSPEGNQQVSDSRQPQQLPPVSCLWWEKCPAKTTLWNSIVFYCRKLVGAHLLCVCACVCTFHLPSYFLGYFRGIWYWGSKADNHFIAPSTNRGDLDNKKKLRNRGHIS